MPITSRYRSLALLLIIVISYAAFNAHAATHSAGDLGGCELCAGHADPSHAIPMSPGTSGIAASGYFDAKFDSATHATILLIHFRQRAPPHLV